MTFAQKLNRPIDNSQLIVFRIFFGILMFVESIGAIFTGWVKETFVEPSFTFNFIGFEFLQVLVGSQAYFVYVLMGILGLMIAFGYRYKIGIIGFTIIWGATYLAQKSHYNNHYYLVWIISFLMCFLPAHHSNSLDVKQNRVQKKLYCPQWCTWLLIAQIAIVYFYASIAKIYPDWLQGKPIEIWYSYKTFETPFWSHDFAVQLQQFFTNRTTILFFSYAGILFDLLVIPFFLWNKYSRTFALIASLIFHLTNSIIFQIGIFPYFALAFAVFFYKPDYIRRLFLKRKAPFVVTPNLNLSKSLSPAQIGLIIFIGIQVLLPIRHHFIPGKVLWTEEGHRLSWRMMLRTKSANSSFKMVDNETGEEQQINPLDFVTTNQYGDLLAKPDMIWQFAQYLENHFEQQEQYNDVSIYVNAQVGVNGRKKSQLTNDKIDIANQKWKTFGHQEWLLPAPF